MNIKSIVQSNTCCGCGTCSLTCPTNAITFQKNEIGYLEPVVESNCVDCGLCLSNCPINVNTVFYDSSKVVSFCVKEEYKNLRSSSAGAAYFISKDFIEQFNGVVYGASWNKQNNKVEHVRVDKTENLINISGSKYVQSDIKNIFALIKTDVENNKNILFIGTPCQVDAIRKSFKYDNLFCIDLVCHGVPPMEYLTEYMTNDKKFIGVDEIRFRGEHDFCLSTFKNDELINIDKADNDLYYLSFLKSFSYRENCYKCKYATSKRVGDITLGDFWGVDKKYIPENYVGKVSLVIVSSDKGNELFKGLSKYGYCTLSNMEMAKKNNFQLNAPAMRPVERDRINKLYAKHGFIKAYKQTSVYKNMKKAKFIGRIKSILRRWRNI